MVDRIPYAEIPPASPWTYDVVNRKAEAERLKDKIKASKSGASILVSGKYGSGKSSFLKSIREDILNEGGYVCYLDAWYGEIYGDPFFSFFKALRDSSVHLRDRAFFNSIAESVKNLSQSLLDIAVFFATGQGKLNAKEIAERFSKGENEVFWQLKIDEKICSLNESLSVIIDNMSKNSTKYKNIIIIVDELDRCSPDYAIRLLEIMKHFFERNGVVFLVAADEMILESISKKCFGNLLNWGEYKRKFFDFTFFMQEVNFRKFLLMQIENTAFEKVRSDFFGGNRRFIEAFVDGFINGLGRYGSFRSLQQSLNRLNMIYDPEGELSSHSGALGFCFGLKLREDNLIDLILNLNHREAVTILKSEGITWKKILIFSKN